VKVTALQWSITLAADVFYAVNFWVLWRRQLWRQLPFLAAYLGFVFVRSSIYVYGLYFWPLRTAASFYWIGEAVIYVLSFLLIMSLWREALGRLTGVWALTRWALPVALLVLMALMRWTLGFAPGSVPTVKDWMGDWNRLITQTLSLTQAVFLLGFFLVIALFSVPVAPLVRRVAGCWFVYSLSKVALLTARYVLGEEFQSWFSLSSSFFYVALVGAWAVILVKAQEADLRAPQPTYVLDAGPRRLAGQLEEVNRSLNRLLKA